MKQKQKNKDLIPVLCDNKGLAENLSKDKEEIIEKKKKMNHSGMEKVVHIYKCLQFQLVHLYLLLSAP